MKKILLIAALLLPLPAAAQAAFNGQCILGGTAAKTSGLNSTNYLNGIIPSCTVTVYLTGTTTKASIYANGSSGTLANPFTANTLNSVNPGGWLFYAATGQGYDIVMSGGIAPNAYPSPVTLVDVEAGGGGGGSCPEGATGFFQINASGVCAASTIDEGVTVANTTTTLDQNILLQANTGTGQASIVIDASPNIIAGDGDVVTIGADGEDGIILCTDSMSSTPGDCPSSNAQGPITLVAGGDVSLRPEGDFIANALGGGVTIESESTTSGGDILLSAGPGTSGSVADIELEADRNIDIDAAGAGGAGVVEISGDSLQINMPVTLGTIIGATQCLTVDSSGNVTGTGSPCGSGGGSGTVTSVTISGANGIGVSGCTITTSGTCALSLGAITPTSVVTGNITDSALTLGSIPVAGTGGLLGNSLIDENITTSGYDTVHNNLKVAGTGASLIQPGTNLFSALPTCASGTEGSIAPVTDSTTNTWGATITGTGTDHVLAYCDGTVWSVAAK